MGLLLFPVTFWIAQTLPPLAPGEVSELFKWMSGLGVGGTIATFIYLMGRRDAKDFLKQWSDQCLRHAEVIEKATIAMSASTVASALSTDASRAVLDAMQAMQRRQEQVEMELASRGIRLPPPPPTRFDRDRNRGGGPR